MDNAPRRGTRERAGSEEERTAEKCKGDEAGRTQVARGRDIPDEHGYVLPISSLTRRSIDSSEVLDLTHEANVKLFRTWDQKEVAFVNMLRFIRISSTDPTVAIVARPGHHFSLIGDGNDPGPDHDRDAKDILKKLAPRQRAQLEERVKESNAEDMSMDQS